MTPIEIKFMMWAIGALLAILAFIGILVVKYLMSMATDIHEIKIGMGKSEIRHEELEKRVYKLEKRTI